MPTTQRTQVIANLIQKSLTDNDKSKFYKLHLNELREANIDLGSLDKDSSYRIALQDRIRELENLELNKNLDNKHNQNLNIGYIAMIISIIIATIGWFYFK